MKKGGTYSPENTVFHCIAPLSPVLGGNVSVPPLAETETFVVLLTRYEAKSN